MPTRLFINNSSHDVNDPVVGFVPAGGRVSISSNGPVYASNPALVDITDQPPTEQSQSQPAAQESTPSAGVSQ